MRDTANNELLTAEENQAIKAKQNSEVAGYTDKRDLVNQLVGRIHLAQGLSKLTTVISVVDLACTLGKKALPYWNKLVSPAASAREKRDMLPLLRGCILRKTLILKEPEK